ncbi:hypothetical protein ACJMK2_015996 [Sinanodonta woodiana]|uniref:Protein rolling stone n=1 Tax=Sinanodonta woodiana TaxID=1069815 RepID=A0ABD3US76_SINWO
MSQFCSYVRSELQLKNFGFGDVHPARFAYSQWRIPVGVYLAYRFLVAVYVSFWLISIARDTPVISFPNSNTQFSWGSFLTNWTYLVLALYLILHFFVCFFYCCKRCKHLCCVPDVDGHKQLFNELQVTPSLWSGEYHPVDSAENADEYGRQETTVLGTPSLPILHKITWMLFTTVSSAALMVTLVFFVFLWPQMGTSSLDMPNLQEHVLNSVLVFLDHIISGIPIRIYHYIYLVLYGATYTAFSAIYWAGDHNRVMYPNVLDWNQPGHTALMLLLVALVILPILHMCFFAIYKVKLFVYHVLHQDRL